MKFSVIKEHRDFFQKQQMIEFNELIKPDKCQALIEEIDTTLTARLHISTDKLRRQTTQALFLSGRDLWRDNAEIKKTVTQSYLAEIASELIEFKPLRLGYDQFFTEITSTVLTTESKLPFTQTSLEEISCLEGVLCGLMICLSSSGGETMNVFPSTPGSGIYFLPTVPIDFSLLNERLGNRYLMIVYVHPITFYTEEERDPHLHALKKLGYMMNDKLNDKFHPIVYR